MNSKKITANRFLAGLLAVLLIISMLPVTMLTAIAATSEDYTLTVTDGLNPVKDAEVKVFLQNALYAAKTTDENGVVNLSLDDEYEYVFVIEGVGFERYEDVVVFNSSKEAAVALTSLPTVVVNGSVVDEEGNGIEGASVNVTGYASYTAVTGEDGSFTVAGVFADKDYNVSVMCDGYKTTSAKLELDGENTFNLVKKADAEVSFEYAEVEFAYGTTAINTATAGAGQSVKYSSSDDSIVTVDSTGALTATGIGEAVITATVDATDDYLAGTATYKVTVVKGTQPEVYFTQSVPETIVWTEAFTNTIAGGISGEIKYRSSDKEIATVDENGVVTFLKPGTVEIKGTRVGGSFYEDAFVKYTITAVKADQAAITVEDSTPNKVFYGDAASYISVTGGSVEGEFTYNSSNAAVAVVEADGKIVAKKAGTTVITVTLPGNDFYKDASVTVELTVKKASQKNDFQFEIDNKATAKYGADFANPVMGADNATVTFASSDEGVATVDNNGKIYTHGIGKTTITATYISDDQYENMTISYELEVVKGDQTVVFEKAEIPALIFGQDFQNQANAQASIIYSSSNEDVVTVDEIGRLTMLKAGAAVITATAVENEFYNSASASYSVNIGLAPQKIVFSEGTAPTVVFNENGNYYENSATSNAVEANEVVEVIYSVVSGSKYIKNFNSQTGSFDIVGAGTIIISVAFNTNGRYDYAAATYKLTVTKAEQTIEFSKDKYPVVTGETFVAPTATLVGLGNDSTITYYVKSDKNGIVKKLNSVTGEIEFTNKAGEAVILATKPGDANYKSAAAEYTVAVTEWKLDAGKIYYTVEGDKAEGSKWFQDNIVLKAAEGYSLSFDKINGNANTEWKTELPTNITVDGVSEVTFYIRDNQTGTISTPVSVEIKKDGTNPTATINSEKLTAWETFLNIITFGTWGSDKTVFTVEKSDATSGIAKVEYYVDYGCADIKSQEELDEIDGWKNYKSDITVKCDEVFVVYVKVTDVAGNYVYATTNGIVFDGTLPTVNVTVPETATGYYVDDVIFTVSASDAAPYSGIKEIKYYVLCNGEETKAETLYSFDVENPEYALLESSWNGEFTVKAEENDSDDVVVRVVVVDNAGNKSESEKHIKISYAKPEIKVEFENEPEITNENGNVTYYQAARRAKITITGRTSVFSKLLPVINVTAVNAAGETVENAYTIEDWNTVSENTHVAYINFNGSAQYSFTVDYTDKANNAAGQYASNVFAVDLDAPTGAITIADNSWSTLLETLTFGLWNKTSVEINATADDVTSAVQKIEYYKTDSKEILSTTDLEKVEWTAFESFSVNTDEQFTVYLKITDMSGRYSYICSDGYIVDMNGSNISIVPDETNENGYYKNDVNVEIFVEDAEPYSGIQKVEYWVVADGKETQREVLYTFEYEGDAPTHSQLLAEFNKAIVIDSQLNNSDNVKLYVEVTDNAGNVTRYNDGENDYFALSIDVTAPVINVSYDNNVANKDGNKGFFAAPRKATVVITERTSHFNAENATKGIVITAKNAKGEDVAIDLSKVISSWKTTEGATPDDATHTATVDFSADANYTVSYAYTDDAGNVNDDVVYANDTVTPVNFAVDTEDPTASIIFGEYSWNKLLETLTFGFWSNDTVIFTAETNDVTSDVTVEYYIDNDSTYQKNAASLDTIESWTLYEDSITLTEDQRYVVYLKVTDAAGNYIYVNADGGVIDTEDSYIEIVPEAPDKNNAYNGDVTVLINVNEEKSGKTSYSGIQKVEYWVTCDGKITHEKEVLYQFDYVRDEGVNSNTGSTTTTESVDGVSQSVTQNGTIPSYEQLLKKFSRSMTVSADKNNSSDVEVFVGVTDNAGNYTEKSLALDIDITAPAIDVTFNNNDPYKVVEDHGYFASGRVATVVITERTNHFNAEKATKGIVITATDVNGYAVTPNAVISSWTTTKGTTPDEDTHTATITFAADANYTFDISYTDEAGVISTPVNTGDAVTPYSFTVDKTAPTGTLTVSGLGTWDKLLNKLTFGLWSNYAVTVSATTSDVTSKIESVSYYKTASDLIMTEADLKALDESAWNGFKTFEVSSDEQFTVYLRIVDFAGNTTYISTDGVIVDSNKPIFKPADEEIKPEITLTPMTNEINGIYSSDVTVAVKVIDPIVEGTYAGLKEIRYEITDQGVVTQSGVLYSFDVKWPTQADLLQSWESQKAIVVDSKLNNSNDVKVKVYAVDNAGNKNEDALSLKIDITKPTIEVIYNNNDGDTTFADGTYFNADRTAQVVITERNFRAEDVVFTITSEFDVMPTITGWETFKAGGNGDYDIHVVNVVFGHDGVYTFDVAYTDRAGNANNGVNYGESLAPKKFTIDMTAPVVDIEYDNNMSQNINYYNAQRTATITVTEHNFDASRVNVYLVATNDGAASQVPTLSGWYSNGDVHVATITFANDSRYVFDFDYQDKARNDAADISEAVFFIDKTAPVVSISGVVDESANNTEENIGFVITATDVNFDEFKPELTISKINGTKTVVNAGVAANIYNGKTYTVRNLDSDGIYTIKCTVVDKAGNEYTEVILTDAEGAQYKADRNGDDALVTFSVNRDGSAYALGEYTESIIGSYYVQNVEEDVVIVETNADKLNEFKVTLNGKELKKDEDYKVAESGGNGKWMKYTYTLSKALFETEGEYNVVIFSKDMAGNDAFSDIKDATVNFVVDRTAPVVTVTGLANDGRYQTSSQKVTVIPTDDGGQLASITVSTVNSSGKVIKELIDLAGEDLEAALEAGEGKLEFELGENLYQNVRIVCKDEAVNGEGDTNTYDETFKNVSVSSSAIMIFWANPALRTGALIGVFALTFAVVIIIILATGKKKDNKKSKK